MTERAAPDIMPLARRVKEVVRLSELAGESVSLRRTGHGEFTALCPFHAEHTPSLSINDAKGLFCCFGCGAAGDAISWMQRRYGLRFADAVRTLAERTGLIATPAAKRTLRPLQTLRPEDRRDIDDANRALTRNWCHTIWRRAAAADDSVVESYLRGRGIDLSRLGGVPPSLRFGVLRHTESNQTLPAMIGAIQSIDREIIGIHRTYLQERRDNCAQDVSAVTGWESTRSVPCQRVVKARVNPAKKIAGEYRGGAVRLAAAAEVMAIAEGIETALSVMMASGLPCWAALSLSNLASIQLPESVKTVYICADNDEKDQAAAAHMRRKALNAQRAAGRRVFLALPPAGFDFNDLLWRGEC